MTTTDSDMISHDGFIAWCHDCRQFMRPGREAIAHGLATKHTMSTYTKHYTGRAIMGLPWPRREVVA